MSTEHQQYSLANQSVKISEYADQHSFEIVKTYVDSGRSGLSFSNRPGLAALLSDVVSRKITFNVVLVYDVSRWGRFQDTDEAAHYEFLCKRAGVPIHYCAEQFPNDGSVPEPWQPSSVVNWASRCTPNRMMMSADGVPKGMLSLGEHKSFTKDRVILTPGPPNKIEVVKNIFTWASSGMPALQIANRRHPISEGRHPDGSESYLDTVGA
jgi:hypothetical protein